MWSADAEKSLDDGMLGGRHLRGHRRVADAVTLVGVVAQGLDDPGIPSNVLELHAERSPLAGLALDIATDSGRCVVDKVGVQPRERRLFVLLLVVRDAAVPVVTGPKWLLADV